MFTYSGTHGGKARVTYNPAIAACPFCRSRQPALVEIEAGAWAVSCPACNAIGPQRAARQTPQEAVRAWNAQPD